MIRGVWDFRGVGSFRDARASGRACDSRRVGFLTRGIFEECGIFEARGIFLVCGFSRGLDIGDAPDSCAPRVWDWRGVGSSGGVGSAVRVIRGVWDFRGPDIRGVWDVRGVGYS